MLPEQSGNVTEIGAGDGQLLSSLSRRRPSVGFTAYDFAPRPPGMPGNVRWIQGDLLSQQRPADGGTLIANLFLHHFSNEQLSEMGAWMCGFETIITNEPLRAKLPLVLGKLASPLIHPITRHDMRVSTEAGFTKGELPAALGLHKAGYAIRETVFRMGFIRMVASPGMDGAAQKISV